MKTILARQPAETKMKVDTSSPEARQASLSVLARQLAETRNHIIKCQRIGNATTNPTKKRGATMEHRWMSIAMSEIGQAETPGAADNPRILEYLATVGPYMHDEIPWCSAFANWVMRQAGIPGTGRANARSWIRWGKSVSPCRGAIAVFWRGEPSGWQGHVGFISAISDTHVHVLGGNQGNRVCIAPYPLARLITARWPG